LQLHIFFKQSKTEKKIFFVNIYSQLKFGGLQKRFFSVFDAILIRSYTFTSQHLLSIKIRRTAKLSAFILIDVHIHFITRTLVLYENN